MVVNPETTTRKLISLPNELVRAIEDFRFSQRVKTESEAIRRLIEMGLAAAAKAAKSKTGGSDGT